MPKFKVGDRVKVFSKPYCQRAVVGAEYVINKIHNYSGPNRGQLYGVEAADEINLFDCEIKLAVPLFRKGDKVLVEYTVEYDEDKSVDAQRGSGLPVSAPGLQVSTTRSLNMLRAGTITRAPEPPYVPKVGDKFSFLLSSGAPSEYVNTLIFSDDKGILYEDCISRRWVSDTNNKFFKR